MVPKIAEATPHVVQENDGHTRSWRLAIIRRWPSPPAFTPRIVQTRRRIYKDNVGHASKLVETTPHVV